jgi:hypothetical protein
MKPRTSRLRRAWNIWLVLPEPVRLGAILAVFIIVAFLTT